MAIRIREESWNRAATENSGIDADAALERLESLGYEVELVDGDWGACYYADTDAEHGAVMELSD